MNEQNSKYSVFRARFRYFDDSKIFKYKLDI